MIKNMKLNKKTIISLLIFVVIFYFFIFLFNNKSIEQKVKSEETQVREKAIVELDPNKMSRITFFNTSKDRVSLAIPEWWEGKYRLKEEGNVARFGYIDVLGKYNKLFVIKKYPDYSWEEGDNQRNGREEKILKKQNTVYTYFLSTEKHESELQTKEYLEMQGEVKLIIRTIK